MADYFWDTLQIAGNAVSDSFGGTPLSGAICIFTLLLMILFTVFSVICGISKFISYENTW